MKTPPVVSALAILLFPVAIYAQGRPGSVNTGGSKPTPSTNPMPTPGTRTENPFPEIDRPLFISGKVVLPD